MNSAVQQLQDEPNRVSSKPRAGDKKLSIALLGYRCNPFSGGQGVYIRNVSAGLAELGHQVDVISGQPYPDLIEHKNIKLIKLPSLNLYGSGDEIVGYSAKRLLSFTDTFEWCSYQTGGFPEPYTFGRRVFRYLKDNHQKYDIIHDNQTLSWGIADLEQLTDKLVTTIHHPITFDRDIALAHTQTIGLRLLVRRWHHFLNMQTKVARKLRRIITVSENSRSDIAASFASDPSAIEIIPNGINTKLYRPLPEIKRIPGCIITTASADQPLKGTQHLIPAIAALRKSHPEIRLVFIGKPKEDGPTAKLIREHTLADCIEFVHGISNQEVVRRYAQATIAVVPSEYEGFGLPAAEAMACGVPVVSTNGGALAEVVGDAGLIVTKGDPQALTTAMDQLLRDAELREAYAQKGRAHIMQHFSAPRAAELLEAYYLKVLDP
ncbi:MAG: glycosyltransferase family 4 protein [Pseudomonadota bacterium]